MISSRSRNRKTEKLQKSFARSANILPEADAKKEKAADVLVFIVLLLFGIYHSILYFGYQNIPNPDFTGFAQTGHELWSLRLPSSYMRMPVLGILQVGLGFIAGGQHPDLTAGWLLNAILHPFIVILLWLVGKEIIGRLAFLFAIIASINPQVIYLTMEPIAETTLLFFVLLSFYLIFKRTHWAYVAACVTSMVRHEGAALILCVFLMDMIYCSTKRQRICALVYSMIAIVPVFLWVGSSMISWQEGGFEYFSVFSKEYSKGFAESVSDRTGVLLHMRLLWETGFRPLLAPISGSSQGAVETLWSISKTVALTGFCCGVLFSVIKRQWAIIVLLSLLVPYFALHVVYPYPFHRFYSTVYWIALLIFLYGMQGLWSIFRDKTRIPQPVVCGLQAIALVSMMIWIAAIVPQMSILSPVSPKSTSLPYVVIFVLVVFCGFEYYQKRRLSFKSIVQSVMVMLFVISNQFFLVGTIGDGRREMEFKLLADWYVSNAKEDDKLALYMSNVVAIFAPGRADDIVKPPKAKDAEAFVRACRDQGITYVAWATREGLGHNEFYEMTNLYKNMGMLREPKNIGPYQFVTRINNGKAYINVFRIHE